MTDDAGWPNEGIEVGKFCRLLKLLDEPYFDGCIFEQMLAIENGWADSPWPVPRRRPLPKPLRRPLAFGDPEQIAALKREKYTDGQASV